MSKKNPTPTYQTAIGIEGKIQLLATEMERLNFIDQSFGLAQTLIRTIGEDEILFPAIYKTKKIDPVSMLPNDNMKAFSFWVKRDPASIDFKGAEYTKRRYGWVEYFVSCIVYMDVLRIDSNYITGKSQMREALRDFFDNQLRTVPLTLVTTEIYDETIENVYEGFTTEFLDTVLLYPPKAAFRFDFSIEFQIDCATTNPYRL